MRKEGVGRGEKFPGKGRALTKRSLPARPSLFAYASGRPLYHVSKKSALPMRSVTIFRRRASMGGTSSVRLSYSMAAATCSSKSSGRAAPMTNVWMGRSYDHKNSSLNAMGVSGAQAF